MVSAAPRIIPKINRIVRSLAAVPGTMSQGADATQGDAGGSFAAPGELVELGQVCRNLVTVTPSVRVPMKSRSRAAGERDDERADHGRRGGGLRLLFLPHRTC